MPPSTVSIGATSGVSVNPPMKFRRPGALVSTLLPLVFCLLPALPAFADDPLAWPPITAQTRPWAYNWWMGSAVDKTNLTRELERYHDAGLGGIQIIPIYGAKGFEDKYINYLSPEWMDMMGWAVGEAHRLGMGVDMTTGTGWCFGGPQVTDEDANASVVVKTYELGVGERLDQKFDRKTTQALVAFWSDGKSLDLTDSITTNGEVFFSPGGNWISTSTNSKPPKIVTVYAVSQKPSGQKVKRAAPGGEGWMLNPIYPPAMDDYLKPFTTAFANYHGPKPRAQYHDSYEYRSDWSPNFFAEFEKRRGYKLQTELPALFGTNDDDHSARVKCDYRQTVSEIMAEESMPAWTKWAHDEGFITRYQAHGSPANWLDLYATADIPETEMFHSDRSKLISKFASSAAHVTGKPLVSSETGTWLEEHFTEKLSDVKYLFDDMFLSGINHVFYHGCCYSPDEAGWPGWHFYASTEMNPRNSIWRDADAVNAYAARVQSILQSGQPDNDILLYWPIEDFWMQPGDKLLPQFTVHARDWFEGQPIGRTAKELWDKGYAFDYVSDAQLKTAKAENGLIHLPHSREYSVVLVPKCKYIPLETFKQLLSLAQNGARVVFEDQLPEDISGLVSAEKRAEFKRLIAQLSFRTGASIGLKDIAAVRFGNDGYFVKGQLKPALQFNAVGPQSALAFSGLSFVRRISWVGGREHLNYFIANHSGTNFDGWVTFFNSSYNNKMSAVLLDPMTGTTGVAAIRQNQLAEKIKEIRLQLHVGETAILRIFDGYTIEGPAWNYWQTNGQPVAIAGPWNVKFIEGGPTLPADFQTAKLASWTTFPDTNTQAFAGTAKYTLEFNLQVAPDTLKRELQLDLGDVRQSARVRVNGKDYGTLITPPFRVVVDNLKPAGNKLEVEVTSVSANRIRDLDRRGVNWKIFHDINIVDINYQPFDASDWPLTDCGLLGPVTLTPLVQSVP
jgi:hypothetical protein